jgi:uncharacterized protein involved in cysteine biosynthesis
VTEPESDAAHSAVTAVGGETAAVVPVTSRSKRPGFIRRAAAGAWHVPAGFVFLLRHTRLWPLAALPALLCALFLVGGLFLGVYALHDVEQTFGLNLERLPNAVAIAATLTLWIATVAAAVVAGLALALLFSAPILDRLSLATERLVGAAAADATSSLGWELLQSLRAGLLFLAAAPIVWALGLVPVVGPLLELGWGASVLAFQLTDSPLARRGRSFSERRRWHREWRWESLGFGLAGLLVLAVPLANLLLAPGLAVGATRLVVEIEELGQ